MEPPAPSGAIARTRELLTQARKEIEGVDLPADLDLHVKSHIAQAAAALSRAEFLRQYRPTVVGRV